MFPDIDINALKDENSLLKGALASAEKKLSEQSGRVVQLQVDGKISRRTLKAQSAQLSTLQALVASKEEIIQSQAEQIEKLTIAHDISPTYLNPLVTTIELESRGEPPFSTTTESNSRDSVQSKDEQIKVLEKRLMEADEDLETLMSTMMPCYQIGYQIRQHNRDSDLARRGKNSFLTHADAICDCAAADSLSDASILLYDQNVHAIICPDAEYWAHYEHSYAAPPDVVLDKCQFGNFLNLLIGYRNMRRYAEEGSTPKVEAAAFLDITRQLIEYVHPLGALKCDQDFQNDQKVSEIYQHVGFEYAQALARHKAFLGNLAAFHSR
ncbi:heavy metal transport/detoxification protein [Marssonina coronariae]|uniref:Heavy metal transport/detoxification protein n=1 Tax=Diplocarpon coronariae TaxID=2795749 RepID=A0A218YUN9_9HELO|nr:heavy metal transport/detoxification protein [Marssonina coronariae]